MNEYILLLTHSGDFYTIDKVQHILEDKGYNTIRLNSDRFPEQVKITEAIGTDSRIEIKTENKVITPEQICAAWNRKVFRPEISDDVDEAYKAVCKRESAQVFDILLYTLRDIPWLDPHYLKNNAENKYFQLECAKASGLQIPETIITNDPEAVRKFYHQHSADVITKMLTPFSVSMDGHTPFVYTASIDENDLENLESLKFCPMVFQNRVKKAYELRVIYVDGKTYAGRIDVTKSEKGTHDWRRSEKGMQQWQAYDLPEEMNILLRIFMEKMQLDYAAIDIIRDTEGNYVFLEANPAGEWGMIEKYAGQPIAEAIAETLIRKIKD